jgi:NOL1/NOP2/fmu family ribosome biogenesis protein
MKNINFLRILNKKEAERIIERIKKHFGIKELKEVVESYGFLINRNGKVFLVSKDIDKVDLSKLKINSIGLYFCNISNGIRLSIEGTQLIGNKAKKGVVDLNKDEMKEWMLGKDIKTSRGYKESVILKYNDDFLGCGQVKNEKILNFVPKNRRIKEEVFV